MSRCIRDLEDELGASLFIRRGSGVTLTVAGERLLPRARMILRCMAEAAEDVAAIGRSEQGRIRIGVSSSLASGFLPVLLRNYRRERPRLDIKVIDGRPADHLLSIQELRMDAAFIPNREYWADYSSLTLWSERLFLALSENYHLANKGSVIWGDLAHEAILTTGEGIGPDLHARVRQHLVELVHPPLVRAQSVNRDNILPLVAMGWGVALDTEAATANRLPGVAWLPIGEETIQFNAVWLTHNDNPALRRLLSMARELSRSLMRAGDA